MEFRSFHANITSNICRTCNSQLFSNNFSRLAIIPSHHNNSNTSSVTGFNSIFALLSDAIADSNQKQKGKSWLLNLSHIEVIFCLKLFWRWHLFYLFVSYCKHSQSFASHLIYLLVNHIIDSFHFLSLILQWIYMLTSSSNYLSCPN